MKKKGSALVFSVLILAFFLGIALNIFFIARKKAERAGVKVQGEKTTNNIDIASSLGYQELKLAEEMVRLGFLYHPDHAYSNNNSTYVIPADGTKPLYIDPATGEFKTNQRYAGIQLNNFIDYFSSEWDPGSSSNQKLVIGEEASGGKVINRIWQSAGVDSTITPLWKLYSDDNTDTSLSVGGYSYNSDDSDTIPTSTGSYTDLIAIYVKFIYLDTFTMTNGAGENIVIPQSTFKVEVEETFDYTITSSKLTTSNRRVTEFVIRAID